MSQKGKKGEKNNNLQNEIEAYLKQNQMLAEMSNEKEEELNKIKNEIEEKKKELYTNNKDKLEINIEKFKYGLTLKYEIEKDYLLIAIEDIIDEINNILKNILENVNKNEIKNVIYTGNNFKFKIFEEILYDYFDKNICEHIFDEELKIF